MYKQFEYLREGITMTLGQTYRIDLPETGMLSGLFLKLQANCTSGATLADELWRLQDHLGAVEVIGNGATIIKSLDWQNLAHIHQLRQKVTPLGAWRNYATNTQFEYLLVLFGRFLGDPDYGLDLSNFDNVELRVTNASSATYHGTDITASILQAYMRDMPGGFRGHIRSEVWREWTTVQDETKYFVLPTEYPFCGVYLRCVPDTTSGVPDTGFYNQADDIDMSIQGGTKQVLKGGLDDLALIDYYMQGHQLIVGGMADINADRGIPVSLGRTLRRATASGSKDDAVSAVIPTIEADLTDGALITEAREADSPIEFMMQGYSFQNTVNLWFSEFLEPETLLDPAAAGEIRLNIHTQDAAAAADGTNQVVIERLVSS